jgi:cell division transport system permease protein
VAINPGYFIAESLQNFRRNWVMSLGAVITIFLSLVLVGAFVLAGTIVNGLVKSVESKVSISVFLKDGAASGDVEALQRTISADARVKKVNYVSKEEALARFKQSMKNDPEIVQQLKGNPLPASLEIELKDPRQVEAMVATIKANPYLAKVVKNPANPEAEDIRYGQQVVKRLFAVTRIIQLIGTAFIIMLALVSIIFIQNTIRLAIYSRRKEIGIMRLVGASNWFIRGPFLLEGLIQGLIGAALAIALLGIVLASVLPSLGRILSFLTLSLPSGAVIQLSLILLLGGMFIGLVGSGFAMRRHLKV